MQQHIFGDFTHWENISTLLCRAGLTHLQKINLFIPEDPFGSKGKCPCQYVGNSRQASSAHTVFEHQETVNCTSFVSRDIQWLVCDNLCTSQIHQRKRERETAHKYERVERGISVWEMSASVWLHEAKMEFKKMGAKMTMADVWNMAGLRKALLILCSWIKGPEETLCFWEWRKEF